MESPVEPRTLRVGLRMTVMAIQHSEMDTLPRTEFSYMSCTELYSTMVANDVRVPQTQYRTWEGS